MKKKRILEVIEDGYGRLSSKRIIGIIGILNMVAVIDYFVYRAVESGQWSVASGTITWCVTTFAGLLGIGALVEKKKKDENKDGSNNG